MRVDAAGHPLLLRLLVPHRDCNRDPAMKKERNYIGESGIPQFRRLLTLPTELSTLFQNHLELSRACKVSNVHSGSLVKPCIPPHLHQGSSTPAPDAASVRLQAELQHQQGVSSSLDERPTPYADPIM